MIKKIIICIFILLLFISTASANLNDCELIQINSTHWYFKTIQTDLADGLYNYQAFANNISSDYQVIAVDVNIPPASITNLTNTTGGFWHNWTWINPADADFNYTMVYINNIWTVNTSDEYYNFSASPHNSSTISTKTVDTTGNINATWVNHTSIIPNNVITISNVSISYILNETETFYIDADYTDADSDTGTFADNSSEWNINTTTGVVTWVTDGNDEGTYNYYINVSDGYGSVNQYNFTVTVNPLPFNITLHSSYPAGLLPTNYTGVMSVHYIVQHNRPLNYSSLAFLFGVNYTITGDMHNYIRVPPNSIAEGIYRAPHRNVTPYLSWEFNDSITGGNIWQWGGGDNDSFWISKEAINATHTWVNITGITHHVLSSSFYLAKYAMYESPKTGFEINKAQGIIIKIWDVDSIRNRIDSNYLIGLVFDTDLEATPSDNVLIRYCNSSFDPDNDDPRTSPCCQDVITADSTRWMNHTWIPHANSSYSKPLVIDASDFDPTDTGFLYLASRTTTGKSFILNATNYDPCICNKTFAQTQTMWTFDESSGASTSIAYTPSFFATFARNYMEMELQLYIADNQNEWAHSGIDTKQIGLSQYPVDPVTFEHFNITCPVEAYILDDMMDATYDDGHINIGLYCPADPDGGNVSHNVTVHYINGTLTGIVNNTLTTNGSEHVEVNFSTTPYYSTTDMYTLKCVSIDEEGSTATRWLGSEFALAADGTQGWVKDDMLLFWGMNDIPTLYSTVNNNSYISYDSGNDTYTMHVPFFKSKCNDTFYFNETVHLESLNDTNISFFRFSGTTIFDNATVLGWNTTSDIIAPDTDAYRGYLFSCYNVDGDITNSNFSYLGNSTLYQQEGLNFIENSLDFLIYNTTLSHNGEGVIMEECSNFNISQCTITDNVNVGIGIYYSNDTIVANNTIDSNGGRGISVYEGNNNIIRYNDIKNSGVHGVHFWSNSQNNTCIGNDVTGSTSYDYYLTSSSLGNFIIDPASSTNKIRSTSTSSVNIENTDNAVFTEDSPNASYAYPTNYSMFVSGVSQTFNITQYNITATPNTDKLSIWNLEWDATVKFNVSSENANNPTWFNLTNSTWALNIIDIYRNGTLYANETADVNGLITYNYSDSYSEKWFEFQEQPTYIPPDPINLQYTEGVHWIHYTWNPGSGNVTDTYNVSYNGTWDNTSSNPFRNESVGSHGYLDIIVYAYNNSGAGTLSSGYLFNNVTVLNNNIILSDVLSSYTLNEGETLSIDANYSDVDNDTGTFADNSSDWNINSGTGIVSWVTSDGDDGTYYWYINVSDGYGSIDTKAFIVTVNNTLGLENIPPDPINLQYTEGVHWIHYTWNPGSGNITDTYNVSYNGTWDNTSSNTFRNESVGAHGYLNIIVYAYNNSGAGTLSSGYLFNNVTVANNPVNITNTSDWSNNEGQNVYVDYDSTDADSDTPTFSCNRTDLFTDFNTATGTGNWLTGYTDNDTYYVDFGVSDGYGSSDNYTMIITVMDYGTAGTPYNLLGTPFNFGIEYTWLSGANTDTFNVSINGSWNNGSANTYSNNSTIPHGFIEIIVYGYNNSAGLSAGFVTDNITIPNNPINITNGSHYEGMENVQALIDFDYTDIDGDVPVFQTNATVGSLNSSTGVFTWIPSSSDAGTHYFEFNVSDGYGSVDSYISRFEIIEFKLTNPNPSDDIDIYKEESPTFSISVSVLANSTWTLDGEIEEIDNNSMNPSYTIPDTLGLGEHTLIINASAVPNSSITDEYTWNFTVKKRRVTSSGGLPPAFIPGRTDEPSENVLHGENGYIRNIKYGNRASYIVRNDESLKVTSISFVPTANSKGESVYIEALENKSVFVTEDVPNHEILNFNLFIGFLDYDSKTEEEEITFKLKKYEIKNAGLDENSIKLYKWSPEKGIWIRKFTTLFDSEGNFYHYISDSDATTGHFAISGEEFIPKYETTKKESTILNVILITILSLLLIGILSSYYNSDKWFISLMIAVILIGIIYILLGNSMINVIDSSIINLFINVILITSLSYLAPGIFEKG